MTFQFILVIIVLVLGLQLSQADCRALRPATVADGGAAGTTVLAVSSDNSGGRSSLLSVRGLAFILASGPSKRGPGH
ncbi:hypothetical protein ACS0TY_024049 [Phlomoides rotata]